MPSDPETAFRVHSNYLRAFEMLIESQYVPGNYMARHDEVLAAVATQVRASNLYSQLQRRPGNIEPVIAILRNAWGTEILLASAGDFLDDELIGLANNWGVVQAYYAIYHISQALAVAHGAPRPQSHPATQRSYCNDWCARPTPLPPWSLGWDASGCRNLPTGRTINPVHDWAACDHESCWDLVAMALRTTREDSLKERLRGKREEKRTALAKDWRTEEETRQAKGKRPRIERPFALPQLTRAEKIAIDRRLRSFTLLDYLFRLRIRSQYVDTEMFTDGPGHPTQSRAVHLHLRKITAATLLVHELLVGRLIGAKRLQTAIDAWADASGVAGAKMGIVRRRTLLV